MPQIKPEEFESQLKSGKLAPVYLFDGPEAWLKNRAIDRLIDKLVPAESRDFNLERFDGTQNEAGQVISSAQSLPWMGEKRLIIVQSVNEFSAGDRRLLAENFEGLPASTCLILVYSGKANLREEIVAESLSHGHLVTFWTPFANQLPFWVTSEVKAKGKTIASQAAYRLAEACEDLQQISDEIEKLCLFVGKKNLIDLTDIEAFGLPNEAGDYKTLEVALWERNWVEALNQSKLMAEGGTRPEMIFPLFERVFKTLILASIYMNEKKMGLMEVLPILGIRGKIQEALFIKGVKQYSSDELYQSLEKITQADHDLKTGTIPSSVVVSLLILNLLKHPVLLTRAIG
ncbi:MAG: DNA polymerase III subunit delta [Elusimicrobiota bacterium]